MENKYQIALETIWKMFDLKFGVKEMDKATKFMDCKNTLQELIDKSTPKKPYGNNNQNKRCPYCKARVKSGCGSSSRVKYDYCCKCGQALDWGEENGR